MQRAVDSAKTAGVTVVVAAGNSNNDACRFSPAFVPNAITVGSTDRADKRQGSSEPVGEPVGLRVIQLAGEARAGESWENYRGDFKNIGAEPQIIALRSCPLFLPKLL